MEQGVSQGIADHATCQIASKDIFRDRVFRYGILSYILIAAAEQFSLNFIGSLHLAQLYNIQCI